MKSYLTPLWAWYVGGVGAVLVTNYLSVRIPMELAHGLDALRAGTDGVGDAAMHIAFLGLGVIGVRTLSRIWFFKPARVIEYNLREDIFAHCLRLQPDFYSKYATGDLLSRTTSDITFARAFAGFGILQMFNVVAALLMTLGQMLSLSPILTLACVVPILVAFAGVQLGIRRLMTLQRQGQILSGQLSDRLLGTIQGVGAIQGYCVEDVFVERLEDISKQIREVNLKSTWLRAFMFPAVAMAGGVSVYLLLVVGGPLAVSGVLTAGDLAAYVSLVSYLLFPMVAMGFILSVIQRSEASLERIYAVLDAKVDRPDMGRALPFPTPGRGPALHFKNLSFGFGPDRQVLKNIDLDIPAGATVGIFGRTGSGKTTLLRLLARLLNPPEGSVSVEGTDLTRLDLDDWRQRVTLVPQSAFLFSESIAENVGFGAEEAKVREALSAAAFNQDLSALPEGLGTVVGERGIVLSGGQRQRVALARGLMQKGEVLLLDDVLSAVDHRTEQELIRTLEARSKGGMATTIIVSHRMSVLEKTDMVLVLDEGRLVAAGPHQSLLHQPGLYSEAWAAQHGEQA